MGRDDEGRWYFVVGGGDSRTRELQKEPTPPIETKLRRGTTKQSVGWKMKIDFYVLGGRGRGLLLVGAMESIGNYGVTW